MPKLASGALTERQKMVLTDLARWGDPDKTMAYRLGMSRKTVIWHLSEARRKLGIGNRMQLADWARENLLTRDRLTHRRLLCEFIVQFC